MIPAYKARDKVAPRQSRGPRRLEDVPDRPRMSGNNSRMNVSSHYAESPGVLYIYTFKYNRK